MPWPETATTEARPLLRILRRIVVTPAYYRSSSEVHRGNLIARAECHHAICPLYNQQSTDNLAYHRKQTCIAADVRYNVTPPEIAWSLAPHPPPTSHRLSTNPHRTLRRQSPKVRVFSFLFLSFLLILLSISLPVLESPFIDPTPSPYQILSLCTPLTLSSSTSTMVDHHEDDLTASKTEGFKVGEKKTLQEYQELGESCIPMVHSIQPNIHRAPLLIFFPPSPQTRMMRPSTAGRPLWA